MDKILSFIIKIKGILTELVQYFDNAKLLILTTLALFIATLILHLTFKKYKPVKYIPGIVAILLGVLNFTSVLGDFTNEESLPKLMLFVIGCASGFSAILFALILGVYSKPVKRKRKRKPSVATNKNSQQDKKINNSGQTD